MHKIFSTKMNICLTLRLNLFLQVAKYRQSICIVLSFVKYESILWICSGAICQDAFCTSMLLWTHVITQLPNYPKDFAFVHCSNYFPVSSFASDKSVDNQLFYVSRHACCMLKHYSTGLATSWTLNLTVAGNISPGSERRRRERIETFIVRATNMNELFRHV